MRYIFLLIALLGIQTLVFSQTSEYPPEPIMATQETTKGPCGEGDGGNPGGISPPVGLCLPINDYIFPLFLSGIALGVLSLYSLRLKPATMS